MKGDSFFMAAAKPRKSAGNTQKHSQSTAPMKKKGLKRKQTVQMQNDDDDYNEDDDDTVNFLDDDLERSDDSQSLASSANDDIGGQSKRESAQEKRVRLAKQYISTLDPVPSGTDGDREEYDAAEIDRSLVAERLRTEAQQLSGRYFNRAASSISGVRVAYQLRGHKSSATCLAVSPHSDFAFSGGKDGLIIQWCLETGKRLHTFRPTFKRKSKDSSEETTAQSSKQREHVKGGHTDQILALAVSGDGQFLASGGKDKRICIWRISDHSLVQTFNHHRDSVTGLVFRRQSNTLYSVSADRTLKLFNLDEMAYVETLFGHQDIITAVDALGASRERCVSTGHRDRTVRLWKIIEESQLVFRASAAGKLLKSNNNKQLRGEESDSSSDNENGVFVADYSDNNNGNNNWPFIKQLDLDETGSLECVSMLDDDHWVTGSDGGVLSLWNSMRKKPAYSLANAHGRSLPLLDGGRLYDRQSAAQLASELSQRLIDINNDNTIDATARKEHLLAAAASQSNPMWITAVACMRYGDLFASGSQDGLIRLWRVKDAHKSAFQPFMTVECAGCVNALQFTGDGRYLVAAVGQEHRLGRWTRLKEARNGLLVIELISTTANTINN